MNSRSAQRLFYRVLVHKQINNALKAVVKPLSRHVPERLLVQVPAVGPVYVSLPNERKIRFESNGDDVISSLLFWRGLDGFERASLEVFLRFVPSARCIMDIGANSGTYALAAGVSGRSDQSIYAFEPIPRVFAFLSRNVAANGLRNVHAIHSAVGDIDGEIDIYVNTQALRLPVNASTVQGYRANHSAITAPITRLDTFVAARGIGAVDLMKIDTETTEPNVLRGAREILHRDLPVIVCEVQLNRTEAALEHILEELGYRYFLITDTGLQHRERIIGLEPYANYLFLPPGKDAPLL